MEEEAGSSCCGVFGIARYQGERVDRAVRNLHGASKVGVKTGFQIEGFLPGQETCFDFRRITGAEKPVPVIERVFSKRDEEPFGLLNAMGRNTL
jgi:hypothetical protein